MTSVNAGSGNITAGVCVSTIGVEVGGVFVAEVVARVALEVNEEVEEVPKDNEEVEVVPKFFAGVEVAEGLIGSGTGGIYDKNGRSSER
jgi:hypothetical protein